MQVGFRSENFKEQNAGLPDDLSSEDFARFAERMGAENLERRREYERRLIRAKLRHAQRSPIAKKLRDKDWWYATILRMVGMYKTGMRNFHAVALVERRVALPNLPSEFEGFRILQISDLHLDLAPAIIGRCEKILRGVRFDQAVITGDFQNLVLRPQEEVIGLLEPLIPLLGKTPLAVPGNHDLLHLVARLESVGIRFLLNESWRFGGSGERSLWFVGVDDPRFFRGNDLRRALVGVPASACKILLSHSPSTYTEASAAGIDFFLCGHTHGGQICWPNGKPIVKNVQVPPQMFSGGWKEGTMQGYTSPGTGGCGVPIRFFCPPEITLHTLTRG